MVRISKYGLKIKNIKAGTLYGFNLGVRTHYDYTDAMLNNSLFSNYMLSHGMTAYKGESTRDIICLDFDFGSRSFSEEVAHINSLIAQDPGNPKLYEIKESVFANKDKYVKKSKDEIRELFYTEGVDVRYDKHDKNGNITSSKTIHYKMLYRNTSKAKLGQVMFIKDTLWRKAINWLTIGLFNKMPKENAKIVEMSAYAPLTTSTIVNTVHIPVENILILKDQDSFFKTIAKVVTAEDYVDNNGKIKRRCVVTDKETEVKNTIWDGEALIESYLLSSVPDMNGMALLRGHMFKACAFKTKIQVFFKDWCKKNGKDYNTYQVEDMFGHKHYLKDIRMITTDNAIKWLKFKTLMGKTTEEAYKYWMDKVKADGCYWGIVKTDHPSKLGNVQQMSYQMVNTLPCTKDEIGEIARTSIEFVERLKADNDEFADFLHKNANEINHYEMLASLYEHNPIFADSKFFRGEKKLIIGRYVFRLRGGKITVNADNLTACGNPYALLLYSVGEDWRKDPCFSKEEGTIQCFTKRFKNGEYLCGIRSPHNSPNNCSYLHNRYSPEIEKYFNFSNNIIAVNCIETDIQARMNGMDFDSDFLFVTNHPTMVTAAKRCYKNYPTIVNDLQEGGVTYNNTPQEYARMDTILAKSRRGIGESSNLAQLAMTYYWTDRAKNINTTFKTKELYDNFVILSVIAQLIIDGSKKVYEVDGLEEIARIKRMECMNPTDYEGRKKDYPLFMKYTKAVPVTKNGNELPFEQIEASKNKIKRRINDDFVCPMNYLQEHLSKIQGASKRNTIPTEDFFVKIRGRSNSRQISKVAKLAQEYDSYVRSNILFFQNDERMDEYIETTRNFYNSIANIKIRNLPTMNRIIESALKIDTMPDRRKNDKHLELNKYCRIILKALFRVDKERFLLNFA